VLQKTLAGFYGALVEAINIAEVQDDDDDDDNLFPYFGMRDRIAGIIRELAESEKGRAGVDAAGALLGAFMIEIARSDGLIKSLQLAKTILKLSKSVEGRAGLIAAGGCGALSQALRIDQEDFEIFGSDCVQDFWELERCIKSALRRLRNNKQ
jgi:hypothetical protein